MSPIEEVVSPVAPEVVVETPAAVTTPPTVPATSQQPVQPPPEEDWKKRFNGLQAQFQKRAGELQAAQTENVRLQELIAGLDTQRSQQTSELDQLRLQVAQLTPIEAKLNRLQMIATEFPDLLELEAEGLLPTASGDELKTKLTALRAKMATQAQPPKPNLSGSVPPSPAGSAPQSSDELFKAAVVAMKAGRLEEYNQLYDKYIKSLGGTQ